MARAYKRARALILILGIFGAGRALANSTCIEDIRAADKTIEVQGANAVSAMAASMAVAKCESDFLKPESKIFSGLSGNCEVSFDNATGTAVEAAAAICKMNAARYIMSLQLSE